MVWCGFGHAGFDGLFGGTGCISETGEYARFSPNRIGFVGLVHSAGTKIT